LFRRDSGCSAEQKTIGIPFRTIPWERKMLGILYSGSKVEANSRNSRPNHSAEEKNAQNSVPSHSSEECSEFRSVEQNRSKISEFRYEAFDGFWGTDYFFGCFLKLMFSAYFCSVPSLGIDSLPWTLECLSRMSTFYRGITETAPCLFREIFCGTKFRCRVATCCW
jgi:hypothetical protein